MSPAPHDDLLDDLGPLRGMSWQGFNNLTRRVRGQAIELGHPLPARANIMDSLLEMMKNMPQAQFVEFALQCVERRKADDLRRRGTRTRGLSKPETRRWSGR